MLLKFFLKPLRLLLNIFFFYFKLLSFAAVIYRVGGLGVCYSLFKFLPFLIKRLKGFDSGKFAFLVFWKFWNSFGSKF